MNFDLGLVQTAFGQVGDAAGKKPSAMEYLLLFGGPLIIMYFFMILPQRKKLKEHDSLLKALKAGDEIVTTGGIIGRVRSIAENFVTIESGNSTLKVMKANVTGLTKVPGTVTNAVPAKA